MLPPEFNSNFYKQLYEWDLSDTVSFHELISDKKILFTGVPVAVWINCIHVKTKKRFNNNKPTNS